MKKYIARYSIEVLKKDKKIKKIPKKVYEELSYNIKQFYNIYFEYNYLNFYFKINENDNTLDFYFEVYNIEQQLTLYHIINLINFNFNRYNQIPIVDDYYVLLL